MTGTSHKPISVLAASTFTFTVRFAVRMIFAIIGVPLKQSLGLNKTGFGLLVATPVLTGSLVRLPLGMLRRGKDSQWAFSGRAIPARRSPSSSRRAWWWAYGWAMVPRVYAVAMLATAPLFWLFTQHDESHTAGSKVTLKQQLLALRDPRVWKYCQYYSIVFGGYVAPAL